MGGHRPAPGRDAAGIVRLVWAGTFEPGFSRNRKLARLLDLCEVETVVVREQVWGDDRVGLASKQGPGVFLKAAFRYPKLLVRLLATKRPDVYLVSYPGWFDVPVVRLVATIKRRPLVFDPFISLYDTMVSDRGLHSEKSLRGRLAAYADRVSLRMADLVIADTEPHLRLYDDLANGLRRAGVVVPVGADDGVFRESADRQIDQHLVLFYGTLVPLQGVETVVEAAALLEADGVRTVIIGDGQDRSVLDSAIARTGASIQRHGMIPLEDLPAHIAGATVCLGIFGVSEKAGRVVPHKLFECMAMGRPVITRDSVAIRTLFEDGEVATTPAGDHVALAAEVRSLLDDPDRRERLAAAGSAAYRERFHEQPLARLLDVALRSVVEGHLLS